MLKFAAIAPVAFIVAGCHLGESRERSGSTVRPEELKLDSPASPSATLVIGDREIPVTVKSEVIGKLLSVRTFADNAEIEHEGYRIEPDAFLLIQAGGETFDPPLPVLKFPLRIGDAWTWSGTLRAGEASSPADAKVATIRESLFTPQSEALRVNVELTLRRGAGSKRNLSFWFLEGRGLVQREFGASIRRPRN